MTSRTIKLITFGNFEKNFLEELGICVTTEYGYPVSFDHLSIEINNYYDAVRRQYNGNELLKEVDSCYTIDYIKIIGLFRIDLFIPILTYIFGQAFLNGNSGIASLYRLKNERYGMEPDEFLLRERFKKEVIHELGHTFGLKHCFNQKCVMRSSTYVEDIDQKSVHLCNLCRDELIKNTSV